MNDAQPDRPHPPARPRPPAYIRVALTLLLMAGVFGLTFWLGARTAPRLSVAVLPIVDLSDDRAGEQFADALSEAVFDRLSKVNGLQVPASASTAVYKNKRPSVTEIGRALKVTYVLDGSVRRTGDSVRVASRLIRVANSAVVWSESYNRTASDVRALQEIAAAISKDVEKIALSGG